MVYVPNNLTTAWGEIRVWVKVSEMREGKSDENLSLPATPICGPLITCKCCKLGIVDTRGVWSDKNE